ncbi:TniQ family protein [Pontibaca salina]|uniref:TniQ family protein n=1 Tax=Pontibaca salina TaxID=2795731 RepID=A0A934HT54_9RHOB|nr:TniQ family protein [Pontibaca salina]MBI6630922.1 TniQ family protein [Pontibaca salina]
MIAPIHPEPNESLDGYLRRLAEAELWADVTDLLGGVGLQYGRRLIEDADEVERLLELPEGILNPLLPSAKASAARFNWRFERHHSAPVCPECISTGRPHHQAWRHAFVTSCVEHELVLIDSCPMCLEQLRPGAGGYGSCSCGCPLDRLVHKKAADWELAISAVIGGQMHPARATLPPSLAFRNPSDIGSFLHFLGGSQSPAITGKPGKLPFPKTVKEAQSFLADAQHLLCNWPMGFQHEVSARLAAGDQTASSAPARLGKWYHSLMQFTDKAYLDFRAVLEDVVAREFDGAYTGGAVGTETERDWVSAAEAARLIGISAERIVDAVSKDLIDGQIFSSGFGHRHTTVRRAVIDQVLTDRARFIDKTSAREQLGISRKQFDLLVRSKFVSEALPAERPPLVDGLFDRVALTQIVAGIARQSSPVVAKSIAFRELNLRFTTDLKGLNEVLRLIANGELRPDLDSTGGKLAEFRFDREEVERVLKEMRRGPGYTVQEVAALTGWKAQCISRWCLQGLLEHEEFDHAGAVGRVVRADALARFQETYVPVSVLARQAGTSPRHLIRMLTQQGIEPVGAFQDGKAWRGHLVALAPLASFAIAHASSDASHYARHDL